MIRRPLPRRPLPPAGGSPFAVPKPVRRSVGADIGRLIAPILKKRGFRGIDVSVLWPIFAGPRLAEYSSPERIRRRGLSESVLTVRVEGAMALEVCHASELVVERINAYYGAGTVDRLVVVQGPLSASPSVRPVRDVRSPPRPADVAAASRALGDFPDGALKTALARLGAEVFADA